MQADRRTLCPTAGVGRISDGVRLIAGGLEALLQGLELSTRRIAIRVELPPPTDATSRYISNTRNPAILT